MKLIYCPECHDVRTIHLSATRCKCQKSWGRYIDPGGRHAEYGGSAIPLGFDKSSLTVAITWRKGHGQSFFDAFVIERECPTFRHVDSSAKTG